MLFKRGNAISRAPTKIRTNQFPKPPTLAGITINKIHYPPTCLAGPAFTANATPGDPAEGGTTRAGSGW